MAGRFEELWIYKEAQELVKEIYKLTKANDFARDFNLVNQIRRAAISVVANIAEGYERGSNTEYIQFLYIAKGSCGEVRAELEIARAQGYIKEVVHKESYDKCCKLSAGISGFIKSLKQSGYKGPKRKTP